MNGPPGSAQRKQLNHAGSPTLVKSFVGVLALSRGIPENRPMASNQQGYPRAQNTPNAPGADHPRPDTLRIIRTDPQRAIDRLEERIRAGESDFRTWHNYALLLGMTGDAAGAREAAERALGEAPESAQTHLLCGVLERWAGRHHESLAALSRAADLDPACLKLHLQRGLTHFLLQDFEAASRDLEAANRESPDDTAALHNLAIVHVARKRYGDARRLFQRLVGLVPERAAHYHLYLFETGGAQVREEVRAKGHQLKNFISVVAGRLRQISESPGIEALEVDLREDLTGVNEDHDRICRDMVALLDTIQPRSLEHESVNMVRLLGRILFVAGGKSRGIRVEKQIAANLPHVRCDLESVQEAFLNILLNAVDAVREAKARTPEHEGQIAIRATADGDYLCVVFEDNGVGIPEGEIDRVFQLGFTTKTLGTGIGLAYARRIIDDHGGTIEVDSEERRGTRITCRIPVKPRIRESLTRLSLPSQLIEQPRSLILEEKGEDLGI